MTFDAFDVCVRSVLEVSFDGEVSEATLLFEELEFDSLWRFS